jgi:hypothetical protein
VFWSSSAFAGVIQVLGLIWLHESYAPVLLKSKRDRLVKETRNNNLHTGTETKSLVNRIGSALVRPARLFTTQPIA